jgi:energy-coupling factor transport system substrate-specific component
MLVYTSEHSGNENVGFNTVGCVDDTVLVGTTSNTVEKFRLDGNTLKYQGRLRSQDNTYFNRIEYSPRMELFFYCSDNGMGYIDKSGSRIVALSGKRNYGTVSDTLVDRQGNVWFASSKNGLVRFSSSPFKNILRSLGADGQVVNALYEEDGKLYIGTDNGLKIVDLKMQKEVSAPIVDEIGSTRIRQIYKDSKDNVWFSLYANQGLLCRTKSGEILTVDNPDNYTVSPKIRFVTELSDGRILVSGNKGLSFVENNKYVGFLGEKEGLNNTTILSAYEKEDGTIMAASDGDGIYLIRDDRVAGHLGKDEGLETGVVMKIVPCTGGRLYITSNSIYFDNNEVIRRLKNFPYNNNFDILFDNTGNAWITSSAGLYVVSEQELLADGDYNCTLLNSDWGLVTTFTANSFNLITDDTLYLCCTEGVRAMPITAYDSINTSYQLHLKEVKTEEGIINEIGDRVVIPATTGRIQFDIAITNYTLSNPLIHYFLDGSGDEGTTCYQNEITPLYFTTLNHGKYVFRIQVLDELTGKVIKESQVYVEKEAQMYELLYFRIYLFLTLSFGMAYLGWLFYTLRKKSRRVIGLQREIVTDPMTGILNKNGSQKALTKACAEEEGILLMIDLDSFKLVNDLYGHDMGDKVLIRFAELIKEAEKEGDIAGRLGGDEFVGFLKNTQSEEDVERVCDALNNGIVQSAKEMMGDDMKIPLGASIGAIRVPAQGTVYEEVFPLADKALYSVKQNGKHGYAFYRKNTDAAAEESGQTNDLSKIKKIIGERNEGKGAYNVNFDKMQVLYRFMCRNDRENNSSSGFFRLRVEGTPENPVTDEAREALGEVLTCNLKRNDIISVYSGDYYVLLVGGDSEAYESAIERVIEKWKESEEYGKFPVKYETGSVD